MADVFGDRVVHVDPDGHALGFLERKNLETKHMTIEEYIGNMPEGQQIDMLLSYNAGSVSESALERLREGGIVLANNWHGSADDLYAKEGLEMVGAVVYESKEFVAYEEAESLLGTEQFVYTPGGINPTQQRKKERQVRSLNSTEARIHCGYFVRSLLNLNKTATLTVNISL